MRQRQSDSRHDDDLDATDELPVLDAALAGDEEDLLSSTGEWPPLAVADGTGEVLATLRESLAVVEERLARREAELHELQARLAAETARADQEAAEARRLAGELEARTAEVITADVRRERERLEARIDGLAAEVAAAHAGHVALARDRDGWRAREAERVAEIRVLREDLRRAGLHAASLLEQLRSREALGRYEDDFRAAGAPAGHSPDAASPSLPPAPAPPPVAPAAVEPAAAVPVAATRAVPPKRYLVRLDDPHAPLHVLAQERISIGRTADNELQIDENWMSRHHATLRLGADATIVEDSGSTNGVFVNGRRVRRELLHDGDEIAFGKARFRLQVHRPGGSRD